MNKKREKQIITVRVGTPRLVKWSGYTGPYLNGRQYVEITDQVGFDPRWQSLDESLKELEELKAKYSCEYTDLSFDECRDCGCYGDCVCSPRLVLQGKRLESDVEFELRIEQEDQQAADKLERERKEFERLKKQFGE